MEARVWVSHAERVELGCDWLKAFARDRTAEIYRAGDALGLPSCSSFCSTSPM
jgi:hypothetical protein